MNLDWFLVSQEGLLLVAGPGMVLILATAIGTGILLAFSLPVFAAYRRRLNKTRK